MHLLKTVGISVCRWGMSSCTHMCAKALMRDAGHHVRLVAASARNLWVMTAHHHYLMSFFITPRVLQSIVFASHHLFHVLGIGDTPVPSLMQASFV